ncbi:MAG: glycosidase [Phycisphaerae bacterium]|nr:glycosidase [Phycisphaerae bacterium]
MDSRGEHASRGNAHRKRGRTPIMELFARCPQNPIITSRHLPFKGASVYNPGATEHDGEVVLLLWVEDRKGFSNIHVARSRNGVDGWRIEPEPILADVLPDLGYESLGCGDARVTYVQEDNCYVAYSQLGPSVGLAKSRDLAKADRLCLIFGPNNKDTCMFPSKLQDHWVVVHRPTVGELEHIWTASSPDLINWGSPHAVLHERGGPWWDGLKVGAGPPPILTDQGWLLIYHGVKAFSGNLIYRAGLALLDREKPHKVLARTPGWVFAPEAPYEVNGVIPNIVLPTGALLRGEELWMYYGAADTSVCLATARLPDLLAAFQEEGWE